MTWANLITSFRLGLVPVFAALAITYSDHQAQHLADSPVRWWALGVFILAATLDGLDGWIARKLNQTSFLGAILDPLADKSLMLTAITCLSFFPWGDPWGLPSWAVAIIIAREMVILGGIVILYTLNQRVPIVPHWSSKVSTIAQMILIGWIMLQWIPLSPIYPACIAVVFTLWSGFAYIKQGIRQLPHPA